MLADKVYRAINTLDAMVGHHTVRYEHFGWASARLDDLANFRRNSTAATQHRRRVAGHPGCVVDNSHLVRSRARHSIAAERACAISSSQRY